MDISKLKVAELKKELKERGLTVTGTKPELVARLSEAMQSGSTGSEGSKENASIDTLSLEKLGAEGEEEEEEDVSLENAERLLDSTREEEKSTGGPSPAKKIALGTPKPPSETEKLQMRAQRFGVTSEDMKKAARAARFNISSSGDKSISMSPPADLDKLKQRADRFGTVVSQSLTKLEEEERIKKRKERFGVVTAPAGGTKKALTTTPKPSNLSPAEEELRRKRAQRFGLS